MLGREAEAPARRAARAEDVRRIEAIVMMRHWVDDERVYMLSPFGFKIRARRRKINSCRDVRAE
jgi:hypothetical protein